MAVADIVQVGGVIGLVAILRQLIQLVVIVWSFRADERGRRHALRVLELLRGPGRRNQKPP